MRMLCNQLGNLLAKEEKMTGAEDVPVLRSLSKWRRSQMSWIHFLRGSTSVRRHCDPGYKRSIRAPAVLYEE